MTKDEFTKIMHTYFERWGIRKGSKSWADYEAGKRNIQHIHGPSFSVSNWYGLALNILADWVGV